MVVVHAVEVKARQRTIEVRDHIVIGFWHLEEILLVV
jgi:hypothetical protein